MSLVKYSLATIFLYGIVFFAPGLFIESGYGILITTVGYLLGAVLMFILYWKQTEPLTFETKHSKVSHIIIYGLTGIIVAILLQNLAMSIEGLFGAPRVSENTQNIILLITQQPFFALAATVGGPIMEEFVFRRALVGLIGKYTNYWVGAIVSAIVFAFAHKDNHLLVYIFLGLFFSGLYAYTGKLWTSMITHVGMNTLVIIVQLIVYYSGITIPS